MSPPAPVAPLLIASMLALLSAAVSARARLNAAICASALSSFHSNVATTGGKYDTAALLSSGPYRSGDLRRREVPDRGQRRLERGLDVGPARVVREDPPERVRPAEAELLPACIDGRRPHLRDVALHLHAPRAPQRAAADVRHAHARLLDGQSGLGHDRRTRSP